MLTLNSPLTFQFDYLQISWTVSAVNVEWKVKVLVQLRDHRGTVTHSHHLDRPGLRAAVH